MASFVTNKGAFELGTGGTVWNTSTIKWLLLTSSAAPTKDTNFVSDVSANELGVSGYARQAMTSPTTTEDDTNDRVTYDCADVAFGALGSGATIGWAAAFRDTGNAATSPVLLCIDVADTATNGSSVTLVIDAAGAAYLST